MSVFAGLSLREIYVKRCRDFRCKPNSAVRMALPDRPDDFDSLQHLDVSRNFVGPRGILPLLDVIRSCRQLRSIDMREQRLEHEAVDALCCAVRRHPTLVRMNLSKNPINIASGGLLLELARANRTLEFILLEETAVKETMTMAIERQLSANRTAKEIKEQARNEAHVAATGPSPSSAGSTAPRERLAPQAVQMCLSYFPASVCELLFDENPLEVLTKQCRDHNGWFGDVQFSAADDTAQRIATTHYDIRGWARLAELYPKARLLPPATSAEVYDLPVMSLSGFQWLFTSVAAAAPTAAHLHQLLLSDEAAANPHFTAESSCGVYAVRLFIDGVWRYVIVDDFVPVDRSGQPIFCPAVEGRDGHVYIWSCLVEKAMAKLHGGYQAIDSELVRHEDEAKARHTKPGRPEKAASDPMKATRHTNCFKTMSDLSGGIGLVQPLHTETFRAEKWWPVMYDMLVDRRTAPRKDARPTDSSPSSAIRPTVTTIAPAATHDESNQTSGGAAPPPPPPPPMAVALSRESAKTLPGIQPHHAYQLIQVVQLNGLYLVELANVCECRDRMTRWRGEWSEESPLWSRYPDVDQALRSKHTATGTAAPSTSVAAPSSNDARADENFSQKIVFGHSSSGRPSFWMSYLDFLQAFEELHCARLFPGTSSGQVEGSWGRHTAGGPLSADTWHTNPHYRVSATERGTAFICLSLPDRRFTASDVSAIGFHWIKDELYPIYDPRACGGPHAEENRFLYRAKYAKSDSLCFETSLEANEDYWFVPSTFAAGEMHHFYVRVFCSVPFVMTHEELDAHWSVTSASDEVLASGAYRSGDDNTQVAFRLEETTLSMHSSLAASLSVGSASLSRKTPLSRTMQSAFAHSVIGSISADSYSRTARTGGAVSSVTTGFCIARAVVYPVPCTKVSTGGTANGGVAGAGTHTPSGRLSLNSADGGRAAGEPGNVAVGLFLAFADQNPAGELSRTVGALADDQCVAESPYVLGNRVYCECPVAAGEAYTLIGCVQPLGTRAKMNFTLFTTIPTSKLTVLPAWPKQSVEVQWRQSGSYYDADNQPQVEIFPARAGARFVVHMCMSEYSCAQATITLNVISNHGRAGSYVVGKIPQEKLLARADYVRDNWVQCAVEIGEKDVDSIIAIPCLQPTGSRGTCVVTISSDTPDFRIRALQGAVPKKNGSISKHV